MQELTAGWMLLAWICQVYSVGDWAFIISSVINVGISVHTLLEQLQAMELEYPLRDSKRDELTEILSSSTLALLIKSLTYFVNSPVIKTDDVIRPCHVDFNTLAEHDHPTEVAGKRPPLFCLWYCNVQRGCWNQHDILSIRREWYNWTLLPNRSISIDCRNSHRSNHFWTTTVIVIVNTTTAIAILMLL